MYEILIASAPPPHSPLDPVARIVGRTRRQAAARCGLARKGRHTEPRRPIWLSGHATEVSKMSPKFRSPNRDKKSSWGEKGEKHHSAPSPG